MTDFIKKLFTGADNATWDLGRLLWAKTSVVYCVISGYQVYHAGAFDPQQWAIGAGAILAAGGGSLALKSKTEPSHVDPSQSSSQ
jgi:hypothetical protein